MNGAAGQGDDRGATPDRTGSADGDAVVLDTVVMRYGKGPPALDGVSARLPRGRITGLVGPDGAGKSTLMRLIAGLIGARQGTVTVLGRPVPEEAEAVRARLGYMPQGGGLYTDLTVAENLTLFADLKTLPPGERQARFDRLLGFTGLAPFTGRPAGKLSGGMAQKLGLACALVRAPELLLLDEPSVGVDPISRRELWRMVRDLAGEGLAVVWSTAYLDEAERCDSVLMLDRGRLLGSGPPGDATEPLEGRCWSLEVGPQARRRAQATAYRTEGVIDAVLHGGRLDLVTAEGADPPAASDLLPEGDASAPAAGDVKPRAPRFEDAFVAALANSRRRGSNAPRPDAASRPAEDAGGPARPAEGQDETAIAARGLTRRFGSFTAVDDVTFSVGRGEVFGLLGPNGAGKSTIFKMLCGLLPPSGGEATVDGVDLRRSAAAARARLGYMAQHFSLYAGLTVSQNLDFFAGAYGLSRRHARDRQAALSAEFGLDEVAETPAGALPLGYKQRLSLAAAILHDPPILFLDEPTSGVDPLTRREFWLSIAAMADAGTTVLVTTHFMDEADYCDRLAVIYRGRLLALETPDGLKDRFAGDEAPRPSIEDAFVALIEESEAANGGAGREDAA